LELLEAPARLLEEGLRLAAPVPRVAVEGALLQERRLDDAIDGHVERGQGGGDDLALDLLRGLLRQVAKERQRTLDVGLLLARQAALLVDAREVELRRRHAVGRGEARGRGGDRCLV